MRFADVSVIDNQGYIDAYANMYTVGLPLYNLDQPPPVVRTFNVTVPSDATPGTVIEVFASVTTSDICSNWVSIQLKVGGDVPDIPPPADDDGDGVRNTLDNCPNTPVA